MTGTLVYKKKKIRYKIRGREHNKSIVLLHGFLESMKIWHDLEKLLSNDFRVISIDLPGFGNSELLEPIPTIGLMADVVNKVLMQAGVKKCVVVGHSMGGYVALAFAERFSSKMKGLVLYHSHALGDTPEGKANRNRAIRVVRSKHRSFIYQFIPELFATENVERFQHEIKELKEAAMRIPPENVVAAIEAMKLRTDKLNVLADARYPVMFIAGKQDSRIKVESIIEQALLPKHSELIILSDVGHMGFIEARGKTDRIIQSFAARVL